MHTLIDTADGRASDDVPPPRLLRTISYCLVGGALASLAPLATHASLVDSAVEGSRRICVYDKQPLRLDSATRVLTDRRAIQVGRGEPCPRSPTVATPRSIVAPSLAILQSSRRVGNDLVCNYALNGITYPVRIARSARCPLTPNAAGTR